MGNAPPRRIARAIGDTNDALTIEREYDQRTTRLQLLREPLPLALLGVRELVDIHRNIRRDIG